MHSRQGQSRHKSMKKLQKTISKMSKNDADQKGKKQISHEKREMTDSVKKLSDKADIEPEFDDQLLVVIEELLASYGTYLPVLRSIPTSFQPVLYPWEIGNTLTRRPKLKV